MAGGGNKGKLFAGCGCLSWLGFGVLVVFLMFIYPTLSISMGLPYPSFLPFVNYGSMCCMSGSFIIAIVGIVMILMGGKKEPEEL
jgi:ABC-type transport system involved in multi-copper enzyme maturation permease subunit